MFKQKFIVIGIDDNNTPHFTEEEKHTILSHSCFSGGKRHYEIVRELLPKPHQWIDIVVPLQDVLDKYTCFFQEHPHDSIIVFASGDPLFFGFANTLQRRIPDVVLTVFPYFNSLQTLAHRIQLPYDDMRIVSLTGRPWKGLDDALIERSYKIGVLTDRNHTPSTIAQRMLEYGYTHYKMYIGEHLGNKELERVRECTLQEAKTISFEHPNNLILLSDLPAEQLRALRPFCISEQQFEWLDGREKMITKAPIRILTLSTMELYSKQVFWDIGFCTGSVSIEARIDFPHLSVHSFEIRPEGEHLMDCNSKRFGAAGIDYHIGDFLEEDISHIPAPDAVFIGGHGGKLSEIILKVKEVLQPNGCIVFNSVSEKSYSDFIKGVELAGMQLKSTSRIALDAHNPIIIMKATK